MSSNPLRFFCLSALLCVFAIQTSGCSTLSVPSASSIAAPVDIPADLKALPPHRKVAAPIFIPETRYLSTVTVNVIDEKPNHSEFQIHAQGTVVISRGATTEILQDTPTDIEGHKTRGGKKYPLPVDEHITLFPPKAIPMPLFELPDTPLHAGSSWAVPNVPHVQQTQGRTQQGTESTTYRFLGINESVNPARAVFKMEKTVSNDTSKNGALMKRTSGRETRIIEINPDSGEILKMTHRWRQFTDTLRIRREIDELTVHNRIEKENQR